MSQLSGPDFIVLCTLVVTASVLLFYKPLCTSAAWRATITPLASIMGSGFLVCAPLLYANAGNYAVVVMACLLLMAYAVGGVIRFNIRYGEPLLETIPLPSKFKRTEHRLHIGHRNAARQVAAVEAAEIVERISHIALAGAYCVSVSYYLQLLASFALHALSIHNAFYGRILVTVILTCIALVGFWRGLRGIERVERVAVGINLAMIAALIAGLTSFNAVAYIQGDWHIKVIPISEDKIHLARLIMGMLIVVQGFETSRFLGSEHPREVRIRTMRWAQLISSAIYLVFLALMALVVSRAGNLEDTGITAIIELSSIVASVLPLLITVTAICSQFAAATADDAGCSGLIESIIKGRFDTRFAYAIVSLAAISLTWLTNVYEIISFASRAFALYYALQCLVAILVVHSDPSIPNPYRRMVAYFMVLILCAGVTVFGLPAA